MRLRNLSVLLGLLVFVGTGASGCDDPPAVDPADVAGDASPDGGDASGDAGDVAQPPGLGIDWSTVQSGVPPRYSLTDVDWLATGWPTDRLLVNGRPDLTNFPNPKDLPLLETYLDHGAEVLTGWGLNGTVFFQFMGAIDPASLPDPATTKDDPKAIVQLVNVTAGSDRYGERMPLVFEFKGADVSDDFWEPNTLGMRPVFGFPLAEGETYCAIVTRAVKDANGRYLGVDPDFTTALSSEPSLAKLNAWLPDSGLLVDDIAVATCFTGQLATDELRKVLAFLETQPLPEVTDIDGGLQAAVHWEFRGHYLAPNFQAGTKPYDEDGDLRFDQDGNPVIQSMESIRFILMVPKPAVHPLPPAGYPVITYAHGTGGDYESCVTSVAPPLVKAGVAVICIDQPLHGERGPNGVAGPPLNEQALVLYSFNFQNARAGRMSFRQSAIDTMNLTRMVAGGNMDLDAAETPPQYVDGIRFDPANILFYGHSHGGLSGALAFGVDPELSAGVLSGAGGVMIETILRRKDPDVGALAKLALNINDTNFDSFHPALTLVQMLVDATDPINYSPYWFFPRDGGTAKHMFVTLGTADHATPDVGTQAMCAAATIPLVDPIVQESEPHTLRGLVPKTLPASGNIASSQGPRTAVLKQYLDGDHWVALTHPNAETLWGNFFKTIREGLPVTISE